MFILDTPVAFIIFNRLDTTKKVFEEIRRAQPKRLYLISDGARANKRNEKEIVMNVREYVESNIDWDCKVFKNYSEKNMGCKERVSTGISWVFENEEEAIILEDDIVPNQSFFRFCQEMLRHYKNDTRVMMVSGLNLIPEFKMNDSYCFSMFSGIWGWATWKRAWNLYDVNMKLWKKVEKEKILKYLYSPISYYYIHKNYSNTKKGKIDTWDYQWGFTKAINSGLGIIPNVNLVNNIGFDREDATHTKGKTDYLFEQKEFRFPVKHKPYVFRDMDYDKEIQRKMYGLKRVWNSILRWFHYEKND